MLPPSKYQTLSKITKSVLEGHQLIYDLAITIREMRNLERRVIELSSISSRTENLVIKHPGDRWTDPWYESLSPETQNTIRSSLIIVLAQVNRQLKKTKQKRGILFQKAHEQLLPHIREAGISRLGTSSRWEIKNVIDKLISVEGKKIVAEERIIEKLKTP